MSDTIRVEVAYFEPGNPFLEELEMPSSVTVQQAVEASTVLDRFSSLTLDTIETGIFSRRVTLDTGLSDGDRVEIYRPLQVDPKQARRLRAEAKKKKKSG
jgi:putative ubiquitin-RnfH superfamily antitoxin RatB of RatAB toxin-antitoxin module